MNKAITDYEKWYYNQDKYIAKKKIGLTEEEECYNKQIKLKIKELEERV